MWGGLCSFWRLQGRIRFHASPSFQGPPISWSLPLSSKPASLNLSLTLTHLPPSSTFKNLCDDAGPLWIIQNNLPSSRSDEEQPYFYLQPLNPFSYDVTYSQAPAIRRTTALGAHILSPFQKQGSQTFCASVPKKARADPEAKRLQNQ